MQSRRLTFSILATSLFTAVLTTTSRADAQTVDVANELSLPRLDATGRQITKRALPLNPEGINAQDCRDDQRIRFTVLSSGFQANGMVQVWAGPQGVDCRAPVNRTGMQAMCWPLVSTVPLQPAVDVDIPVRSILAPPSDASVCGTVDLTVTNVTVMMFEPGNLQVPVVSKTIPIAGDTIGPQPPRVTVTPGNGRARAEVVGAPGGISSFVALVAFCEKSKSNESCSASSLVAGGTPDPALQCGEVVGSNASTLLATPLENDTNHVVAVAARDSFDNVGPLSNLTCTIPTASAEPATDDDGGTASGGGCAVGPGRREGARDAFAACALAAFACVVVRRLRPNRSRSCP